MAYLSDGVGSVGHTVSDGIVGLEVSKNVYGRRGDHRTRGGARDSPLRAVMLHCFYPVIWFFWRIVSPELKCTHQWCPRPQVPSASMWCRKHTDEILSAPSPREEP